MNFHVSYIYVCGAVCCLALGVGPVWTRLCRAGACAAPRLPALVLPFHKKRITTVLSRACPLRRLWVALRFIFRLLINFLSTLHFTSEVSTFYSSSAYPTRRGRNITEMPRPGGPSPTQHATCQYSACHRTSVRPCHVRAAAVSMEAAPCSPVAPHSPCIVLISAVRHFYRLTTTKVELRAIVAPPGAARWK